MLIVQDRISNSARNYSETLGRGDYVVSDKDNHASIVAGTLVTAGMASYDSTEGNSVVRYKHNDMNHLEHVLSQLPAESAKFIVSDGVLAHRVKLSICRIW